MTLPSAAHRRCRIIRDPRTLAVTLALALVAGAFLFLGTPKPAGAATVGAGSYTTTLPAGQKLPTGCGDHVHQPPRFASPPTRPRARCPPTTGGRRSCARRPTAPSASRCTPTRRPTTPCPGGLGFSYTTTPTITGTATGVGEYHFPYTRDFLVGVAGLNAGRVKVDGWTDWTVSPYWVDGGRTLKATIGHGLPFATSRSPAATRRSAPTARRRCGPTAAPASASRVRGHDYVAYAPTGATLDGQRHDRSPPRWPARATSRSRCCRPRRPAPTPTAPRWPTTYGRYAHAHVTGTQVSATPTTRAPAR